MRAAVRRSAIGGAKPVTLLCAGAALALLLFATEAFAQVELVQQDFFPAEFEFKELTSVRHEETITEIGALRGGVFAPYMPVFGFRRFASRSYDAADGTILNIEVLTLTDSRAAYSLLTLARTGPLLPGPPGDGFAPEASGFSFAQGSRWVRISGSADPTLMRRVGQSVSNRIGGRLGALPSLVYGLPSTGQDATTLRYFVGAASFSRFGGPSSLSRVPLPPDVEVARCSYSSAGTTGELALLSFPTSQVAEEFLDRYSREAAEDGSRPQAFTRRSGPLVGIVEGRLTADQADSLLASVRFTYSIKWIYDRRNQSNTTIWGVPVGILGTVVRSLALTALLCLASILGGVAIATFRVMLRKHAPRNIFDNPERTELIRLKLDEK